MNEFRETIIEELHLENPAVEADHAVRLDQMNTALSGLAATVHTQLADTIPDFTETVQDIVGALLAPGDTIEWAYDDSGNAVTGAVRLKTLGGLLADASGLYVATGSGIGQIAAGNHSHAQLHDALTVVNTDAVTLTLSGQELQADLNLGASSGLEIGAGDGLRVVFGTTAGTVAAGDHVHANDHLAVTVLDSTSIDFTLAGQQITAVVVVDPAPPVNGGRLLAGGNGLYAVLGTGSGVAAAGDHTHSVATTGVDGFMSAADKLKLDGIDDDFFTTTEGDARYALRDELAAGQVWVGNAAGTAVARSLSGDVTLSNSGVATIAAGAVTDAKIGTRTTHGVTEDLTGWLEDIAQMFGIILGNDPDAWDGVGVVDKSLSDLHSHISENGTNPHETTAADVGLGNVGNYASLPLTGSLGVVDPEEESYNMTGPIYGVTRMAINAQSSTSFSLLEIQDPTYATMLFRHGSTSRFSLGAVAGATLSGIATTGDAFLRLHRTNGSLWLIDAGGDARLRLETLIDGDAGSALGVHYGNALPAVRAILGHGGNAGGYGNLGGVQIVAQGANQATAGSGAIHLLTSTANSAGSGTDATVAGRLSILYDGKIGFGTTAPAVAFHFVSDGGVMRIPVKSTTGDPSGAEGDIYYNAFDNLFRFYQGSAWTSLGSGGGGSVAGSVNEVQFNNGSGFAADANFTWDATNDRLALGQPTADFTLDVAGTVRITGTNALRFGGTGSGDYTASIQSAGSDQLDIANNLNLASGKVFKVNGTQLISSGPATGWTNAGTYSQTRGDINSGSITLPQLADRVATVINDLRFHGLFAN